MLNSHHILTNRNLKGHCACRTYTGFRTRSMEARRIRQENRALVNRRFRLAWLVRQWIEHVRRCRYSKEKYQ